MMNSFLLNFLGVDEVRAKYGLSMDNLLDVGSSSEVYLSGENVLRLSTDGSTQTLIELGNELELSVPKMIKNHGTVGSYIDGSRDGSLWLCEIEKMEAIPASSESALELWIQSLMDEAECEELICQEDFPKLKEVLLTRDEGEYPDINRTILGFIRACDGEMDINISNFMQRRSTEEIVWVDPAHGMCA